MVCGAASCKKQIDLRPTDTIDDTKAFQTVADLEKGLIGVYSSFGGAQFNGVYFTSLIADESKLSNENRGQGQFTFKWQYASGIAEHNADYQTYYRAIDRANRILVIMDRINTASAEEVSLKNKVRAELLALRGMSHFELLRRFMSAGYDPASMGVPLMLESNLTGKPARNSVAEVIAQVESDLNAARQAGEVPSAVPTGLRLGKAAIASYQARVAQLKRDWNAAITFSTDAITLSATTLATRAQYAGIWSDVQNTEVLLRFRNNYALQSLFRDTNGDVFFEPSDKLKSQYNRTTDVRYNTFFGTGSGDTSIIVKFPGSALQGPQNNDVKAIRLSELYLLRAEAYAETNQLVLAAADINALRTNRISGYTNISFNSKDEAITAILNERYKELPYEAIRFFDLKRRSLGISRNSTDVQSSIWQQMAANSHLFAMPIPQDEIFANPNTVQNPGY